MKTRDMVLLFLLCRLTLLISLSLEGLRGFGDFLHFFHLAGMGLPMIDYWVEFPPLFPFFSRMLYVFSGGREHVYDYLLAMLLSIAQAGCLWLVLRLSEQLHSDGTSRLRGWVFFAIHLVLPYGWWYFDAFAVLATLLGLYWLFEGKDSRAGLALAMGTLTKFFPALILPIVWRWTSWRRAFMVTLITLGVTLVVYVAFFVASPRMTVASIVSQGKKGSWETIWALIDNNYQTGNFGPESERFDPSTAQVPRGNPSRIPPWLTLILFGALGGWLLVRAQLDSQLAAAAMVGITWVIFLLWSPGYSPQWILYLLPLVLLVLPIREAVMYSVVLVLVNVLEWPVMLSRGYNWGLWLTILLRTFLLISLTLAFWRVMDQFDSSAIRKEADWRDPELT